ncbi:YdeI/OmpD-associated family protein [Paeniglutamicibacter sp. R2-26]|uniref:YdeI/OmpD-associated family protein n=1 Tax=Paeniglutamicibacter sp. R2-26 TaxID=3144417 RepID=UPI003EE772A5
MAIELEELLVPDEDAWRSWLHENHASHPGVQLVLHKKGGSVTELTYAQAVEQALCFGWIDGRRNGRDAESFSNRFTPRTTRSTWSAKNVETIARLTEAGLMVPAGLAAVDSAKADGRWDSAYAGQKDAQLPEDFVAALEGHPAAQEKLATLGRSEIFAIYFRLHTVKREETRRKKIAEFIAKLDAGQGIF